MQASITNFSFGYCLSEYEFEESADLLRIMYQIVSSQNLIDLRNLNRCDIVGAIAREINLSAHVRCGNYIMDVMSRNHADIIMIRTPSTILHFRDGKFKKEHISKLRARQ